MKNLLRLIIDAAKNDDMNRVIELAENKQDKFCDNNCVWTDHHKDCVRAEQKPVVEVRLVAGGKPMFLMCVLPESFKDGDLLYTTPQQRAWVGLTEEDWDYLNKYCGSTRSAINTAETLLKGKNT